MKKLALIFSLAFFAFVISASAQSAATSDKGTAATTEQAPAPEKVKSDDDMSKGCGAFSSGKSAKAKCCAKKDKSMAKGSSESPAKSEAVVSERKAVAATGTDSK